MNQVLISAQERERKILQPEPVTTSFSPFLRNTSELTPLSPPWPDWVPLFPLLTFSMTAAGGIDAEADNQVKTKIYFSLLFFTPFLYPSFLPSSCCFSSLICEGVLTSPAAEALRGGWLGDLKALFGMHCPWVFIRVYVCCLHYSICRLVEGCASDKTEPGWLTWGASQAVRGMALRGGPFLLHCPSQGSPGRGLDRVEAVVLLELQAAGRG